MSDDEGPGPTRAQSFGRWATAAARAAKFNVDGQRGRGRAEIAELTGMPASSVGRILSGKSLPSPRYYAPLAKALRRPLRELLIEVGVGDEEELGIMAERLGSEPVLSPRVAAERMGIRKPANIDLVVSLAENLLRQEQEQGTGNQSSGAA